MEQNVITSKSVKQQIETINTLFEKGEPYVWDNKQYSEKELLKMRQQFEHRLDILDEYPWYEQRHNNILLKIISIIAQTILQIVDREYRNMKHWESGKIEMMEMPFTQRINPNDSENLKTQGQGIDPINIKTPEKSIDPINIETTRIEKPIQNIKQEKMTQEQYVEQFNKNITEKIAQKHPGENISKEYKEEAIIELLQENKNNIWSVNAMDMTHNIAETAVRLFIPMQEKYIQEHSYYGTPDLYELSALFIAKKNPAIVQAYHPDTLIPHMNKFLAKNPETYLYAKCDDQPHMIDNFSAYIWTLKDEKRVEIMNTIDQIPSMKMVSEQIHKNLSFMEFQNIGHTKNDVKNIKMPGLTPIMPDLTQEIPQNNDINDVYKNAPSFDGPEEDSITENPNSLNNEWVLRPEFQQYQSLIDAVKCNNSYSFLSKEDQINMIGANILKNDPKAISLFGEYEISPMMAAVACIYDNGSYDQIPEHITDELLTEAIEQVLDDVPSEDKKIFMNNTSSNQMFENIRNNIISSICAKEYEKEDKKNEVNELDR